MPDQDGSREVESVQDGQKVVTEPIHPALRRWRAGCAKGATRHAVDMAAGREVGRELVEHVGCVPAPGGI
jgi:hypothetical protein